MHKYRQYVVFMNMLRIIYLILKYLYTARYQYLNNGVEKHIKSHEETSKK